MNPQGKPTRCRRCAAGLKVFGGFASPFIGSSGPCPVFSTVSNPAGPAARRRRRRIKAARRSRRDSAEQSNYWSNDRQILALRAAAPRGGATVAAQVPQQFARFEKRGYRAVESRPGPASKTLANQPPPLRWDRIHSGRAPDALESCLRFIGHDSRGFPYAVGSAPSMAFAKVVGRTRLLNDRQLLRAVKKKSSVSAGTMSRRGSLYYRTRCRPARRGALAREIQ